ncbi:MAG: Two-component system response regulator, partial [Jatrophihabitans sp.]|nr:Two-component system response regulator [Jatrophihabitans sp.]
KVGNRKREQRFAASNPQRADVTQVETGAAPHPPRQFEIGDPSRHRPRRSAHRYPPADDKISAGPQHIHQAHRIARIERGIAVADRDELRLRSDESRVTGGAVAAPRTVDDEHSASAGDLGRSVRRAVVVDDRAGTVRDPVQEPGLGLGLVQTRQDDVEEG